MNSNTPPDDVLPVTAHAGIYMMAATVLASVVWPSMEAIVSTVFVGVCVLAGLALTVVIGRWVHGELALPCERWAATVPFPCTVAAWPQAGSTVPALSELRGIA